MATFRLLLVAALLALPLWVASVVPAHACNFTYGPAVRASDVIVVGLPTSARFVPPEPGGSYGHAEVAFEVRSYMKGSGPSQIQVEYPTSLLSTDESMKGRYCEEPLIPGGEVLAFLTTDAESHYSVVRPTQFVTLDNRYRDTTISQITAIVAAEQTNFPATGSGPVSHNDAHLPLIASSALAAVGLATNAAYALRRRN